MTTPMFPKQESLYEWAKRIREGKQRQGESQAAKMADQEMQHAVIRAEIEARRPMTDQIMSWWNSLPPDVQARRRWQLAEIVPHLRGRYRQTPHRGNVTRALRELGWTYHRDFSARGRGLRYWMPPGCI